MMMCKRLFSFFLLFVLSECCFGFSPDVNKDSLKIIISTTTNIKTKIDALNTLAYEYRRGDKDSGKAYTTEAYNLSKQINYHTGMGDYFRCMGSFLFYADPDTGLFLMRKAIEQFQLDNNALKINNTLSNIANIHILNTAYDSALIYSRLALAGYDADKKIDAGEKDYRLIWIYQTFSNVYYYKSIYDSSLFYGYKGLAIAERTENKNAQATILTILGNVLLQNNECEKAVAIYRKISAVDSELKNIQGYILDISNLGNCFICLADYKSADSCSRLAIKLGLENDITRHIPHNYDNLGLSQFNVGNYDKAISFYLTGLEANKKYKNDFTRGNLLLDIANAYVVKKEYKKAIDHLNEALTYFDDDLENQQYCYEGLSKAYTGLGDFKNALITMQKTTTLKDSVFKEENRRIMSDMNYKYQSEKKEQQILMLQQKDKLNAEIAAKELLKRKFAVGGILILLFVGIYLFYLYQNRKKMSNRLSESLIELKNTQAQLISIEKEKEAEAVRLRISRDIHDDIGSNLTKISMLGNLAVAEAGKNTPELTEHLNKISDYARNVNSSMSEIIWAVNPKQDTLENLLAYMKLHAQEFLLNSGINLKINFPHESLQVQLNPELKRSLFLTVKECLNNAVKYSRARNIKISFSTHDNNFELLIADDGRGFDVNEIAAGKGGNGLRNLEARLKSVGCTFSVDAKPQHGCTINVKGVLS